MADIEMRENTADSSERSGFLGGSEDGQPIPPLYTRIRFSMFLFVSFIICLVVKDGLHGAFNWLPSVKDGCSHQVVEPAPAPGALDGLLPEGGAGGVAKKAIGGLVSNEISGMCAGYEVVFRLSFTCFVFFLIHAMVNIREFCCVSDAQKNAFQADHFCIKIVLFILVLIGVCFIPNGFFHFYAILCTIGSGIFLVIQVILLIDAVYGWNDSWAGKAEDESRWACYLVFFTVMFYIVGGVFISVMYYEFINGDCDTNGFLITATLVLGVFYTMLSVKMPHGSIFVSSSVFLYTCFLCFVAIRNGDSSSCNNLAVHTDSGLSWTLVGSSIIAAGSIAWSALSAGSQRQAMMMSEPEDMDEETTQARNYLFFHVIMALGSMYMAMILTNWSIDPNGDNTAGYVLYHGTTVMWVQISSQWLATTAFIWTLLAPVCCCKDRDYDFSV
eukprot:TRINITY_DN1057_c3_g1_i1.p1 TRINITY_DN1057_c3_g1~~TRINITY_DN1057_c3_g1_i1.p1  ORF type:complete len:464 (+),score=186.72 TRINITY_DN1057_c3_g1_i1:64-1392(+)